ncbi:MAG: carbohydrate porin, partial [Phycisphaerae bacterium]|nr:carbohydrate porin [Phycisphaerae bacterium]
IGKLDLGGGFECQGCPVAFDSNAFANDETAQFLNGALVNNPTIPFPDKALGLVVFAEPIDGWYVAAGAADAQGDARETGFNTAFHDEDYFFGIFETGFVADVPSSNGPLVGAYRAGFWYDPQPKSKHGSAEHSKRDDIGMYLSFDQVVLKETADESDSQGLGLFARWGFAHSDVNPIRCFWSVGGQYQGLVPGRDDDVMGLGFACGNLVRAAGYDEPHEAALEMYYSAQIAPWLSISPSLQYIWSPGGTAGVGNAVVLGARVQISL